VWKFNFKKYCLIKEMASEEDKMEVEVIGSDDEIESDDGNESDKDAEVYLPNKKPLADGKIKN
jgi:hypothetical protein